jgi:hypothetical protein
MSSLKSYFRKKHKYETQADLKDMTAEQIINIKPNEVGYYLDKETGGIPLEGVKRRAMYRLLAIKKQNKATPNESAKQRAITQFLQNEGIKSNPEVDKLIANVQTELVEENMEKIREKIGLKNMENRLRALDNKPPVPYTEEENYVVRLDALKAGKRKRKTVSKRKNRERTRKYRKGSKLSGKSFRKTNRRRK